MKMTTTTISTRKTTGKHDGQTYHVLTLSDAGRKFFVCFDEPTTLEVEVLEHCSRREVKCKIATVPTIRCYKYTKNPYVHSDGTHNPHKGFIDFPFWNSDLTFRVPRNSKLMEALKTST